MRERAFREKTAYNESLQRGFYEKIFRHCDFYARLRREELLKHLMRPGNGGDILELGSQSWPEFILEAEVRPRSLHCINISESELNAGIEEAKDMGLCAEMHIMDAHELKFPDNSFDLVYGAGILHHLDFEVALQQINRVLRPGGHMVFIEPLDNNPIGILVRAATPKARTTDEVPLRFPHLELLSKYFDCEYRYEQFLAVPCGVLSGLFADSPENWLNRTGFNVDQWLLRKFPKLGPYFRHVLVAGQSNLNS